MSLGVSFLHGFLWTLGDCVRWEACWLTFLWPGRAWSSCLTPVGVGDRAVGLVGVKRRTWSWARGIKIGLSLILFALTFLHLILLAWPEIKYSLVSLLLKRAIPEGPRSISLGKVRKLSTPKRIEIQPEWASFPPPVHPLHWFGGRIQNGEVLFRASLKTYNCNVQLLNLSWISVVRIVSSSQAWVSW